MAPLLLALLVFSVLPLSVLPFTTVPYAPHCNSTIPEPTTNATHAFGVRCHDPSYRGYFSGGDEFLGGDGGVSPDLPLQHHRRTSFQLFGNCDNTPTDTPGTFRWVKTLRFQPPHSNYYDDPSSSLSLSLQGYSSEISGEACLVGSGTGYPVDDHRVIRMVEAVVHIRYPKNSSASDALIVGTVKSLDEENHPSHFKPISLWFFHTEHYHYTLIPEAENLSVQLPDVAMESLAFSCGLDACSYLQGFGRIDFYLRPGAENRTVISDFTFGALNGNLFTMMGLKCSPEGRLHSYLLFSDSHPSETWISEGLWDMSRSRFTLVGCPTRETAVIPGDCSIGISLWFPTTMTINRSSPVMGEIGSRHPDGHPVYFPPVPFGVKKLPSHEARSSRQRYEFSRIEDAKRFCQSPKSKAGKELYYSDTWFVTNKGFSFNVTNPGGVTVDGGYAELLSMVRKKYLSSEPRYVSYNFRNLQLSDSSSVWDISAEGIYDQWTGTLCMVGCRSLPTADVDCEIQINIELPSRKTEVASGVIKSGRKTSDILYFEPLRIHLFSSSYFSEIDTDEDFLSIQVHGIVYAICSTLACVFLALQISHAKRHPYAAPSVSILMVAVGIAFVTIPTLHNLIGCTRSYGKLLDNWWTSVAEAVHRTLLIVALALQCYLLRIILVARSILIKEKSHSNYERRALFVCLPVYLIGFAVVCYSEQTTSESGVMRSEPLGSILCTFLVSSLWFSSYAYQGFLLPQVVLNFFGDSKRKPLCAAFYVGTTMVEVVRRLLNFIVLGCFFNDARDILIPSGQLVLAAIIYLQQRSGDASCCTMTSSQLSGNSGVNKPKQPDQLSET